MIEVNNYNKYLQRMCESPTISLFVVWITQILNILPIRLKQWQPFKSYFNHSTLHYIYLNNRDDDNGGKIYCSY